MTSKPRLFGSILAVGALLSACGSTSDESATPTTSTAAAEASVDAEATAVVQPDPTTGSTTTTSETPTSASSGEEPTMGDTIEPAGGVEGGTVQRAYLGEEYPQELSALVDAMRSDAAAKAGVSVPDVSVMSLEEVTWSDASLGCPQPAMAYAQVLSDGLRVVFDAGGTFYDYRSGESGEWFPCVKAPVNKKSSAGLYELTEDGIVQLEAPSYNETAPTDGTSPPDE